MDKPQITTPQRGLPASGIKPIIFILVPVTQDVLLRAGFNRMEGYVMTLSGYYIRKTKRGPHPRDVASTLFQVIGLPYTILSYFRAIPHLTKQLEHMFAAGHFALMGSALYFVYFPSISNQHILEVIMRMGGEELLFTYKEPLSETQRKFIDDVEKAIKVFSKRFTVLLVLAASYFLVEFPIKNMVLYGEVNPIEGHITYGINTNLPAPIMLPIDLSSTSGYMIGCVALLFSTYVYVVSVIAAVVILYSVTSLARLNFQVLNESIKEMEPRARAKAANRGLDHNLPLSSPGIQQCMLEALRENIQHHQIILKYSKLMNDYLGIYLLGLFLSISILLSVCAYLVVSLDNTVTIVKVTSFLFIEMTILLYGCTTGEAITNESARLFDVLYETPWAECGKHFRLNVHIMLANCLQPVRVTSKYVVQPASLETFSTVVNTTYSYFNLLRTAKSE